MLDLVTARILFSPWCHNFNVKPVIEEQGKIHAVTAHFLELSSEYKPLLDETRKLVRIVLKRKSTIAFKTCNEHGDAIG